VHHIGYLVKHLPRAREGFLRLGYEDASAVIRDSLRRVDLLFMKKDGYTIELVTPAGSDSSVTGLLLRYRNAPYHLCYETDAFDEELAGLEASGFTRIDGPAPAPAFGGRRAVFLMSPAVGMTELLESAAVQISLRE
jgi:methylmalonyl-CoA/ethylmalonyl-CoA epimerase